MNPKLRNILFGVVAFGGGYLLAHNDFATTTPGLIIGVVAIFAVTYFFTRRK